MTSAVLAALLAGLLLGIAEAFGRFYPSRRAWIRLRSRHGRKAIWAMRERLEAAADANTGRKLGLVLVVLVVAWLAAASLLDKRWHEVVLDVLPSVFVIAAVLRAPTLLRKVARRMRDFERERGEDPDEERGEGGPAAIAL